MHWKEFCPSIKIDASRKTLFLWLTNTKGASEVTKLQPKVIDANAI